MKEILTALLAGRIDLMEAEKALSGVLDLGKIQLDTDRQRRTGLPEVIYGEGKSLAQLQQILQALPQEARPLVTRLSAEIGLALKDSFPSLEWHPVARILKGSSRKKRFSKPVALLTAGSSDQEVAEEAAVCLEHLGVEVLSLYDVGIAGPHRLLGRLAEIKACAVAIVVAGMDGALPSFAGGLLALPIIAVPTSVGYGVSFSGVAPLLTMLNSCAAGVSVVNIDNGFGAAMAALRILQQACPLQASY